jgi:hypothetical protein
MPGRILGLEELLSRVEDAIRARHSSYFVEDFVTEHIFASVGSSAKTIALLSAELGCCELKSSSRWGRDAAEQNEHYSLDHHDNMATDSVRVDAYARAIQRVASGRRVLDLGSGPFCLLGRMALGAGAMAVDSVEHNMWAVRHALALFVDPDRNVSTRSSLALLLQHNKAFVHPDAVPSNPRCKCNSAHFQSRSSPVSNTGVARAGRGYGAPGAEGLAFLTSLTSLLTLILSPISWERRPSLSRVVPVY